MACIAAMLQVKLFAQLLPACRMHEGQTPWESAAPTPSSPT